GTMGFGLPAAMGAAVGCPDRLVCCVAGDGSVQMNAQELATCSENNIPIKVFIMNNGYLGMVRQWQELFWDGKYSHVDMGRFPDFVKLAEAHGATGMRCADKHTLVDDMKRAIATDGPVVVDVRVTRQENTYPMIPAALHPIDQVTKQLHKLVNVLKIRDLEPADTVARELALFKVSADGVQRGELMQIAEIFRGKVVDVSKRAVIIEVTGTTDKIAAFESMVRPFGLIEMMRTGEIAISRGRGET